VTDQVIRRVDQITLVLCSCFTVFMYFANPYIPTADQKEIWQSAVYIVEGKMDQLNVVYLSWFPQQKSMILIIALLMRTFGNHIKIIWLPMGFLSALIIPFLIRKLAGIYGVSGSDCIYLDVFLILFVPIPLYSVYFYGNLPALALPLFSFYTTEQLIKNGNTRYLILTALSAVLAVLIYQYALICVIAVIVRILFELIHTRKQIRTSLLLILLLMAGAVILPAWLNNTLFTDITGMPASKGFPTSRTIAMGISVTEQYGLTGTGSYNASFDNVYEECNYNINETDRIFRDEISAVLHQYMNHERSPKFFVEKTVYQWLDPWFASLGIVAETTMQSYPDCLFIRVMSCLAKPMEAMLTMLLSIVYFMALVGLVVRARERKALSVCEIYFFGLFLFQLVWEQRSRYCLPAFVACVLIGAEGMQAFLQWNAHKITTGEK
jgi:hypothetical protein